jgi:hypothetical protein
VKILHCKWWRLNLPLPQQLRVREVQRDQELSKLILATICGRKTFRE